MSAEQEDQQNWVRAVMMARMQVNAETPQAEVLVPASTVLYMNLYMLQLTMLVSQAAVPAPVSKPDAALLTKQAISKMMGNSGDVKPT